MLFCAGVYRSMDAGDSTLAFMAQAYSRQPWQGFDPSLNLAWRMQSAMAPLHRTLRVRAALQFKPGSLA